MSPEPPRWQKAERGRTGPYRNFAFTVEVGSIKVGGFQKVSGLGVQMQPEEYEEGGVNHFVHKLPGQYSHSNLVLEQGITTSMKLWNWIKELRNGKRYRSGKRARKTVTVRLHPGYRSDESKIWRFRNAYPVNWEGPDLSADASGSSAVAIQRLEFAHEGFTMTSR